MEEDFRAFLLANAALSAKVASRIDWEERPKAAGLPAITLTLVSRVPIETYKGSATLKPSHVQADVWAATAKDAALAARLLAAALPTGIVQSATRFQRTFLDLEQSGGTEEIASGVRVFRRILDLIVWHSPA